MGRIGNLLEDADKLMQEAKSECNTAERFKYLAPEAYTRMLDKEIQAVYLQNKAVIEYLSRMGQQ